MNESTVNIADFRGIREIKPRTAARQTDKNSLGFLVLDSTTAFERRDVDHLDRSREIGSTAVFDIGMVREAQRFGHRYVPSVQRGGKVLRFTDAAHSKSQGCRGVATWNESGDDPTDCPPAA